MEETDVLGTVGDLGQSVYSGASIVAGGVVGGISNMLGAIGAAARPIFQTAPMGVAVGYGGYHMQRQGFFRGAMAAAGFTDVPSDATPFEYRGSVLSDFGERLGMGATAAGATLGGIGLGTLAARTPGLAKMGGAIGSAIGGPIGVGGAMGTIGRFAVPWLAAPMAGYALGEGVVDAVRTRREIEGFLESSSFRFAGVGSQMADAWMGRGMGRDERRETAEMIRRADIEDALLDTGDLQTILEEGSRYGLFSGAGGELNEFKRRFNDIKENVREMAKTLNTTLEESLATLKEFYAVGMDPSQGQAMSQFASGAGRVAGRTAGEMLSLGLQGAELFRGTGVSMEIGMRGAMMNLTSIRAARDAGMISQEAIAQAGGEEALAMRQTQRQVQFATSAEGRGYMAAFFDPATGGLDAGAVTKAITGGALDVSQLAMQAAQNLSSPAKLIQFESQQEQIATELGKAFGGRGLQLAQWNLAMAEATYMSKATGATTEDSFGAIMLRKGYSPQELEAMQGEMAAAPDVFAASQKGAQVERDRRILEEAERTKPLAHALEKIYDAGKNLLDIVAKPLNKAVDDMSEKIQKMSDAASGITRADVSKIEAAELTTSVLTRGPGFAAGQNIREMGATEIIHDASRTSSLVSKLLPGVDDSAGARLAKAVREGLLGSDVAAEGLTKQQGAKGLKFVLDREMFGDEVTGMTQKQAEWALQRANKLGISKKDIERLDDLGKLDEAFGAGSKERASAALHKAFIAGDLNDPNKTPEEIYNALLTRIDPEASLDSITTEQSALIAYTMDKYNVGGRLGEFREGASTLMTTLRVGRLESLKAAGERFEALSEKVGDIYGFTVAPGAVEKLAVAKTLAANRGQYEAMKGDPAHVRDLLEASGIGAGMSSSDIESRIRSEDFQNVFGRDLQDQLLKAASQGKIKDVSQLQKTISEQATKLSAEAKAQYDQTVQDASLEQLQLGGKDFDVANFQRFMSDFLKDPSLSKEDVVKLKEERLSLGAVVGKGQKAASARIKEINDLLRRGQNVSLLGEMGQTISTIGAIQGERGGAALSQAIMGDLMTKADLSGEEAVSAGILARNIAADKDYIFNLSEKQKDLLEKTTTGTNILRRAEAVKDLKERVEAGKLKDPEDRREAFEAVFGEGQAEKMLGILNRSDMEGVAAASFQDFMSDTAGTTGVAAGGYTKDRNIESAEELYRVFTNQNMAIYSALMTINQKLRE